MKLGKKPWSNTEMMQEKVFGTTASPMVLYSLGCICKGGNTQKIHHTKNPGFHIPQIITLQSSQAVFPYWELNSIRA